MKFNGGPSRHCEKKKALLRTNLASFSFYSSSFASILLIYSIPFLKIFAGLTWMNVDACDEILDYRCEDKKKGYPVKR